jgi:hypothetical protein
MAVSGSVAVSQAECLTFIWLGEDVITENAPRGCGCMGIS